MTEDSKPNSRTENYMKHKLKETDNSITMSTNFIGSQSLRTHSTWSQIQSLVFSELYTFGEEGSGMMYQLLGTGKIVEMYHNLL